MPFVCETNWFTSLVEHSVVVFRTFQHGNTAVQLNPVALQIAKARLSLSRKIRQVAPTVVWQNGAVHAFEFVLRNVDPKVATATALLKVNLKLLVVFEMIVDSQVLFTEKASL
jgi:hypothetical protein